MRPLSSYPPGVTGGEPEITGEGEGDVPDFVGNWLDLAEKLDLSDDVKEAYDRLTDTNDGPVDAFVVIARGCDLARSSNYSPDDCAEAIWCALQSWTDIYRAFASHREAPSTEMSTCCGFGDSSEDG